MNALERMVRAGSVRGAMAASFGVVLLALSTAAPAQYNGAESCIGCHETQYNQWQTSGHRFILMEDSDAENRALPLPEGLEWSDISYVIGGNKTKSLYLNEQGYIHTPGAGKNQYNLLTGEWSNYRAGESNAVYDCGECHTTGYDAGGSPEGLPGISGTFALPGVECEHCHGPGMTMEEGDPAICKDCHNHGPDNAIAAAGGFILSEGQHNELSASPHAALSDECVSCHNPHQKAEFGIKTECSSCHSAQASAYAGTLMDKVGVECQDCHMAPATLSAQPLGPKTGDMKSHIFYINTNPAGNMFTPDGNNVALTGGKAALTLDFVCQRCHEGTALTELAKFAKDFHNPDKGLADIGLNPGLSGTWWNPAKDGEGFVLEFGWAGADLFLFASLYTYDGEGKQVWLVAVGTATPGATSMNVDVVMPVDGKWGDALVPADVNRIPWGTGTFSFPSCNGGSFTLAPNADMQALGFTNVGYDLSRILGPGNDCPTFANNTR